MAKALPVKQAKSDTRFFSGLVLYIIFVCATEALFDFLLGPRIDPYQNTNLLFIFVEPLYKLLCWLLPTFVYLRFIEHEDPIAYLKLNTNVARSLLWGLVVAFCIVALILANKYLHLHQHVILNTLTPGEWLNVVILVGFMEEIPFRGVIFQKLNERLSFWWAALLSALVFLELHLVYWTSLGKPVSYLLSGAPSIFLFALITCALLKRTGSLWGSIVFHAIYDFTTLFFA